MNIRIIYFNLACALLIPIGLVSSFFNYLTRKAMIANWENYPYEVTVRLYTPDSFTIFLHQIGPVGIISFTLGFTLLIGATTFVFKSKYSNPINATILVVATYFLVTTLAWLLLSMSVLAKY